MDKRHLLCVRSSLLSGFVPFSQNQAFLSSFSPMNFFIETLQFTYSPLPTPVLQMYSFIHSLNSQALLRIQRWPGQVQSSPHRPNAISRFSGGEVEDAVSTQRTGTSSRMCVVKEWFSEERNGLRMETKTRSRSWSGKAEQEPRHRGRVLGGGTRKAQLQT